MKTKLPLARSYYADVPSWSQRQSYLNRATTEDANEIVETITPQYKYPLPLMKKFLS